MKFAEWIPALGVLIARQAWLALDPDPGPQPLFWRLSGDWISVVALLWIALACSARDSRRRQWSIGAACAWLAIIYGAHQGVHTWAGWR